jgi:hypothetical protein
MLRTRTHGHAMPTVATSSSAFTAHSLSSSRPVTVQAKRAVANAVWRQK